MILETLVCVPLLEEHPTVLLCIRMHYTALMFSTTLGEGWVMRTAAVSLKNLPVSCNLTCTDHLRELEVCILVSISTESAVVLLTCGKAAMRSDVLS